MEHVTENTGNSSRNACFAFAGRTGSVAYKEEVITAEGNREVSII